MDKTTGCLRLSNALNYTVNACSGIKARGNIVSNHPTLSATLTALWTCPSDVMKVQEEWTLTWLCPDVAQQTTPLPWTTILSISQPDRTGTPMRSGAHAPDVFVKHDFLHAFASILLQTDLLGAIRIGHCWVHGKTSQLTIGIAK